MTTTEPVTPTTTTTTKFVSIKNPPVLTDSIDYELWKKEVSLWQICSDCDKKKQAPAIVMSLNGSAKEAALEMEIETLNSDEGVAELFKVLDGLYLKDENQRKYYHLNLLNSLKDPLLNLLTVISMTLRGSIIKSKHIRYSYQIHILHIDYLKLQI